MKKNFHLITRRIHRYLGLVIGVQFLLWTLGGLYFSWSDMDQVHGDHQRKRTCLLAANLALISPKIALENIRKTTRTDSLISVGLIQLLGMPVYQISVQTTNAHHPQLFLADALTGKVRKPLNKTEAIQVASQAFNGLPKVLSVQYLTATNTHHEYRQQPLPAFAVTFDRPYTTVYVATELGTVQKMRTNQWRAFDFLWMLHTMDYQSRDNIGNWLLRAFSIFGLLTILSGFVLFGLSSKTLKKLRQHKKKGSKFSLPPATRPTLNQL